MIHFTCTPAPSGVGFVVWERCRFELRGPGTRHYVAPDPRRPGSLYLAGEAYAWPTQADARAAAARYVSQENWEAEQW